MSQIFGSDELSARSHPIQQRMSSSFVAISKLDAEALSLAEGDLVEVGKPGNIARVSVRNVVRQGTAAVYAGDAEFDAHAVGEFVSLARAQGTADSKGLGGLIISDNQEVGSGV